MFIWDIYKWEERNIEYIHQKIDGMIVVQIIKQTHINRNFSGFHMPEWSINYQCFLSRSSLIMLVSVSSLELGPSMNIFYENLPKEIHGTYKIIYMRGDSTYNNNRKIKMPEDIFERFKIAVEEYNTAFSTKII